MRVADHFSMVFYLDIIFTPWCNKWVKKDVIDLVNPICGVEVPCEEVFDYKVCQYSKRKLIIVLCWHKCAPDTPDPVEVCPRYRTDKSNRKPLMLVQARSKILPELYGNIYNNLYSLICSQPRWLSGLTRSCVHSQWLLVDQCVLSNWDRILVRAVKGLISRAGMVSICPLLWQRDVKLQQTTTYSLIWHWICVAAQQPITELDSITGSMHSI